MKLPCYVVDAFSDRPFGGNPAGVVLDGATLPAEEMQRIAAELKHSETAFPVPSRRNAGTDFHLRWFTPLSEVRFCGHATLATLHVLVEEAKRIAVGADGVVHLRFGCKAGVQRVELSRHEGVLRILFETPPTRFRPQPVPADALAAMNVVPEALDPRIPPHKAESEEGNLYFCVRDREALARMRPDPRPLDAIGKRLGVAGFVPFTLAPKPGIDAALRAFFPFYGIDEDPVTGSACGHLALLLQELLPGALPRGLHFRQGDEVGRPGKIDIALRPDEPPYPVRAYVGGSATVIVRGELEVR
ncbi:MAG: PhzF family phenazine biosynthesis protein [Myxococcales bacterium]